MSFGAGGRERRAAYSCISSCGIKKRIADGLLKTVFVQLAEEKRASGSEGKTDPSVG